MSLPCSPFCSCLAAWSAAQYPRGLQAGGVISGLGKWPFAQAVAVEGDETTRQRGVEVE